MFRDLLVHVDGSEPGRRRVRFAVDLVARTGARLCGLHVTPPAEVPRRYKPSLVTKEAANISAHLARDARASAMIFGEETKKCRSEASWFESDGGIVDGICDKARYADLVIIGQYERQGTLDAHPLPVANSIVTRCGRPVLVLPAAAQPSAFAKIAVAWDGSREAVRAVHDALPLLRLAQSTQIVKTAPFFARNREIDATSLSVHLMHHGIHVEPDVLEMRSGAEPVAFRQTSEPGRFDLVVIGGYSRPAWLEFIFGGPTQSILLSSSIPVFVSH